jgi:hypothetical protein
MWRAPEGIPHQADLRKESSAIRRCAERDRCDGGDMSGDPDLAERISNVEIAIAFLLGMAAEHRARADEAERGARELSLSLADLRAEQAWNLGQMP